SASPPAAIPPKANSSNARRRPAGAQHPHRAPVGADRRAAPAHVPAPQPGAAKPIFPAAGPYTPAQSVALGSRDRGAKPGARNERSNVISIKVIQYKPLKLQSLRGTDLRPENMHHPRPHPTPWKPAL